MNDHMENSSGLSEKQAQKLLFEYGENRLEQGKKLNPIAIFAGQFRDVLVMILLLSTIISIMMGEITEAFTIISIVIINAVIGFMQEYRTEKTLDALKNMASPTATVIRDGKKQNIEASLLVPGDLIVLKPGDKIPADAHIIEAVSLQCDESLITGESLSVEKHAKEGDEQENRVFMGTVVTKGRGKGVITATGMDTQMGRIAGMLNQIEEPVTPLQKRLSQLGKYIAIGCLLICAVVSLTGILRGEPIVDMLITGISLSVAAIPEGLTAIVTISLALAMNRILKRNALVKKLHAVETLGCANVICSDKTGTLTENKMSVQEIFTLDHQVKVSGNGYSKTGELKEEGRFLNIKAAKTVAAIMDISVMCTNSQISEGEKNGLAGIAGKILRANDQWDTTGEPTEIALLVMAAKAGTFDKNCGYQKLDEIPFDSTRKLMSVIVQGKSQSKMMFTKGAPDMLIDRCRYYMTDQGMQLLTDLVKKNIMNANDKMASKALRVLGFAMKKAEGPGADKEQDLVFVGLVGMIDPPRKEAYEAVMKCKRARIKPIMITGDHKTTAMAIAKDLKIFREGDMVITGKELDSMSDIQFQQLLGKTTVFARVSPEHKLRIVRELKKRGDTVAMTGDGVNDAPAIKEADIGVAMGVSGTDVTKEAASVILLDDNFATLIAAVEEGRIIYQNIRKSIRYLLSCNIGEVLTMFLGMLMGLPVVLLPIHILLVNLVTDSLPAVALGLEPGDEDTMTRKPRGGDESVFSNGLLTTIIFRGFLIGLTTLAVFVTFLKHGSGIDVARTAALFALIITQLFHVFECKSETRSLFSVHYFNNFKLLGAVLISMLVTLATIYVPQMRLVFKTVPLSIGELLVVICYALIAPIISAVFMMNRSKPEKDSMRQLKEPE